MVHTVRNTLKSKDMKSFASDLKTIYNAISEDEGQKARERVVEKWFAKYPCLHETLDKKPGCCRAYF